MLRLYLGPVPQRGTGPFSFCFTTEAQRWPGLLHRENAWGRLHIAVGVGVLRLGRRLRSGLAQDDNLKGVGSVGLAQDDN
jgi:hypothetical protein